MPIKDNASCMCLHTISSHAFSLPSSSLLFSLSSFFPPQCKSAPSTSPSLPASRTRSLSTSKTALGYSTRALCNTYRSVISPAGSAITVNFTDGKFIHNSSPIYTVVSVFVPPAEVFRYVRFQLGGEPLSVEAQYGCDKDGNEQVEFMPVSGGATQLGFCVVQDRAGTYDLSLKPRFGNNNPCIDMVLATAR